MKLVKILFHSYRSLVDVKLQVDHNCIGFVGINESGKSNILSAIHVLGGEKKLTEADTPKMVKSNPFLTFCFELSDDEYKNIHDNCKNKFKNFIPDFSDDILTQKIVNYNIVFSKEKNDDYRYFEFPGIKIDEKLLILIPEKTTSKYQIMTKNGIKNIDDCYIITNEDYQLHLELEQKADKLSEMMCLLRQKEEELSNLNKIINEEEDVLEKDNYVKKDEEIANTLQSNNENNLRNELLGIKNDIKILADELKEFKIPNVIIDIEKKNTQLNANIKNETLKKSTLNEELKALTSTQTEKKSEIAQQIAKIDQTVIKNKNEITDNNKIIVLLKEKINEKYTNDIKIFVDYIHDFIKADLDILLPKVIFWTYNDKYLQDSEVSLDKLLQQNNLNDISRPLVNIFRISYQINSIEDLKNKIKEAQKNNNERSRITDQLTKAINDFLKTIWEDYKHRIKITVEKGEMRVEIFDPENQNASYYSLVERSQGCRTFISFLLTIGAEATKGVLRNSILLLDEPETHLHPTGVKFMLKELIKISSSKNNIVFFATHSMFMIDRNNFSRHVIVEKKKEKSEIKYALSDRIGCFMQEEVLYNALNIEFEEFDSSGKINFVFEGLGDTVLFKNIYSSLQENLIPYSLDDCVFHHGGGCKRIEKYFNHKELKVNSKWIFILDSDTAAENLKKFIEGKYKNNLKKEIFVFHYKYENVINAELEDLLPENIKLDVYNEILREKNIDKNIEKNDYLTLIMEKKSFIEQFKKICEEYELTGDDIKELFKEKLNILLEKDVIENTNDKEKIKSKYNNYYEWFESVIKTLKENTEPKKEKNDPKETP